MDIRSANEEIRNLKNQLVEKDNQLVEKDKYIQEISEWSTFKTGNMLMHIRDARKFHGRNQVRAADFDVIDRVNRDSLGKWLRFDVIPHVKFFNKSTLMYSKDKSSFCQKLLGLRGVVVPEGALENEFYIGRIIPQVNKVVIDNKSKFTTDCRLEWMSE